jgi:hypothetical protein
LRGSPWQVFACASTDARNPTILINAAKVTTFDAKTKLTPSSAVIDHNRFAPGCSLEASRMPRGCRNDILKIVITNIAKFLTKEQILALYKTTDSDGRVIAFGRSVSTAIKKRKSRRPAPTVDDFRVRNMTDSTTG